MSASLAELGEISKARLLPAHTISEGLHGTVRHVHRPGLLGRKVLGESDAVSAPLKLSSHPAQARAELADVRWNTRQNQINAKRKAKGKKVTQPEQPIAVRRAYDEAVGRDNAQWRRNFG